ncbi:hypothetical protein JKG68_24670 [Microvirga aerilata]|uniref:Uncharacterized protein n=1 Tax=Microvirga aerilata TaxID=670292 RepID=A0A937D1K7_9HYPH|nr:hypothetical protein [Microvirga aerilata]MBL0407131.1 hypothetical protein [Microvirga aerilata]
MPRASSHPDDIFDGLRLPIGAWQALEEAQITSLEQLKIMAPHLEQIRGIDPKAVQIIKRRLERLAARRTVRVRLIFPKRPHRKSKAGGRKTVSCRKPGGRAKSKKSI